MTISMPDVIKAAAPGSAMTPVDGFPEPYGAADDGAARFSVLSGFSLSWPFSGYLAGVRLLIRI